MYVYPLWNLTHAWYVPYIEILYMHIIMVWSLWFSEILKFPCDHIIGWGQGTDCGRDGPDCNRKRWSYEYDVEVCALKDACLWDVALVPKVPQINLVVCKFDMHVYTVFGVGMSLGCNVFWICKQWYMQFDSHKPLMIFAKQDLPGHYQEAQGHGWCKEKGAC